MTITIKIDSKAEYRGKNEYYKRKEYEGEAGKYKISGDAYILPLLPVRVKLTAWVWDYNKRKWTKASTKKQ